MYPKTTKLALKTPALLLLVGALCTGLSGQSSTPPPANTTTTTTTATTTTNSTASSASAAENQGVTTLEKFTVSDVPVTEQVLPTVRPVGDVMGDETNIIDIPRSVSSVNEAWMKDRMVENAMDFGPRCPSSAAT
jgi:hypothetical protein